MESDKDNVEAALNTVLAIATKLVAEEEKNRALEDIQDDEGNAD